MNQQQTLAANNRSSDEALATVEAPWGYIYTTNRRLALVAYRKDFDQWWDEQLLERAEGELVLV